MHQWFRSIYSRKLYSLLYGWALRGTPIALLDRTAEHTAALISMEDRNALHGLHGNGLRMLIISCGTLDLCERVLQKAGVRDCFETIKANPLILKGDRIAGIEPRVVAAEDKLSIAKKLIGILLLLTMMNE